jgi:group I intron endonuclease
MILDISIEFKQRYFSKKEKGGVIYKITNLINNDFYIGSTNNLVKRYYTHINHIRTNRNTCIKLIRAVNKYGENNFKFEILIVCPQEYILKAEQWFIDKLKPKYNIAKIAGSNLGIKRTVECKLQRSILQKQKWQDVEYRESHLKTLSKNWKSGSSHCMAKLTEDKVINIKKLLADGITVKKVSEILEVSYHSVKDIKRNKTWKNVII